MDIYDDDQDDDDPSIVVRMPKYVSDFALPTGWIGVNHQSGGIIYLHKESRVVTWSRPYCIDKRTSLRKHDIPLLSIPCLYQKTFGYKSLKRKHVEENCTNSKKYQKSDSETKSTCPHSLIPTCPGMSSHPGMPTGLGTPVKLCTIHPDKVELPNLTKKKNESVMTNEIVENGMITVTEHVNEVENPASNSSFCVNPPSKTFDTSGNVGSSHDDSNITPRILTATKDERKYPNNVMISSSQSDIISSFQDDKDKLLKHFRDQDTVSSDFLRGYLKEIFEFDILTEQHKKDALYSDSSTILIPPISSGKKKGRVTTDGKTPIQILNELCQRKMKAPLKFQTIDSGLHTEYIVEVIINCLKYGIGKGDTVKQAKHQAASVTIDILDPKLMTKTEEKSKLFQVFDDLPIEGMSVPRTIEDHDEFELQDNSYEILYKIMKRHYSTERFKKSEIAFTLNKINEKNYQYEMKCREFVTNGECRRKKYAKQLAAQAIIQQLYPDLKCWGSVLRLSKVSMPESKVCTPLKKGEEEVTRSAAMILALKNEMRKISTP